MTFEQILAVVDQLPLFDQHRLALHLQTKVDPHPERSRILAEVAQRYEVQGYDTVFPSLYGMEAVPPLDLSEEALLQLIHEAANEWEKELDNPQIRADNLVQVVEYNEGKRGVIKDDGFTANLSVNEPTL